MSEYLLAGDIGGTKTNLSIVRRSAHASGIVLVEGSFMNREHASIQSIVDFFLHRHGVAAIDAACFGVAGAVRDGVCDMPNLGWRLAEEGLADQLGIPRVILINDLVATAHGIDQLSPDQLLTLNAGRSEANGNRALIAAGTGLGEALMLQSKQGMHVSASEGGHCDFAPGNEVEIGLLQHLWGKFGHASVERVVSGSGLFNIYEYLHTTQRFHESAALHSEIANSSDPAALIAINALSKQSRLCEAALHVFVAAYGAEAGNLALKSLATGGIYIGGGIAPKIMPAMQAGSFLSAFVKKGRFSSLLSDIPVHMIMEPRTALFGAIAFITRTCQANRL